MKTALILAAAMTLPALMMAAQFYAAYRLRGAPIPFVTGFLIQLCLWEVWTLAGPVAWHLANRWPIEPPHRLRGLILHAVAAPLMALAALCLYLTLYHALIRVPAMSGWFAGFDRSVTSTAIFFAGVYFHVELLSYVGVVAVAQIVRTTAQLRATEREALRLESALTEAKLAALRMQLHPHFLFNALHTVGSLVMQRHNERAVTLLAELGDLLRTTLAHRHSDLAPFREEIAYLRRYLQIEEARFGDRLSVRWTIEASTLDALVPPFILQPLLENAIRHGIAHRTGEAILSIAAAADDGFLRVSIYNDGPRLSPSFRLEETSGFGLQNVRLRLSARDPPGRLELANARRPDGGESDGVRATIVMPSWKGEAGDATSGDRR